MLNIKKVIRRIPTDQQYGFFEVELEGYATVQEIEEDAQNIKDKVDLRPITFKLCEHQHVKYMSGISKQGKWSGYKCKNCGGVAFRNGNGFGPWREAKTKDDELKY